MASLNKLNRAFDSLKRIVSKSSDEINRQKLKLTPCLTITELVCKSNEKNTLLPFAITSLIQLLEDADSNTRLVIDESLNKIIRCSIDNSNHVAKILIALLKVLGKGTNGRCLRAALWRFAKLAHHVRPLKGKIYVKSLLPVIVKLASRREESVHETLADSLPEILKHIGMFSSDHDSRVLLKTFLRNLNSDSIEIRRAAAISIVTVCEFSRKPQFFFSYSLSVLLDSLYDAQHSDDVNKAFVQGCLSCVRQILPHFTNYVNDQLSVNNDATIEKLLEVYEQCLFYAKFRDHNVITAALETLHQLLQQSNLQFLKKLTTVGGLFRSTMCKQNKLGSTLSLSAQSDILSIGSTIAQTEDGIFSDGLLRKMTALFDDTTSSSLDLNEEPKQERTEKWIHDQTGKENDEVSSSSLLNINASHFANSDDDEEPPSEVDVSLSLSSRALSADNIQKIGDDVDTMCGRTKLKSLSIKSIATMSTISGSLNTVSMELDIGNPVDEDDVPLNYCSRFLTSMFLLESPSQQTKHVRVSVMSLALSCLSQLLRIYPTGGLISIERNRGVYENYNNILEAVLVHVSHEDHQIRGFVRIVIGNFVASSLIEDNYRIIENEHCLLNEKLLNDMLVFFVQGLEDESSICVKHSLHGMSLCLESLLLTPEFKRVLPVFDVMFTLVDNPYWLIKIKVLEMVGELPYELLYYVSDRSSIIQDRIFEKVILVFLSDPDGRVRDAASRSLSKFVRNAYYPLDHRFESVIVTYSKKLNSKLATWYQNIDNAEKLTTKTGCLSCEERSLSRIVHEIRKILAASSSKNTIAGCCEALSALVNEYRPVMYPVGWQCFYFEEFVDDTTGYSPLALFDNLMSLMTNTPLILNFDIHLSILVVTSELFIALCQCNLILKKKMNSAVPEGTWSFLVDQKLAQLAESFLQHLTRLASIMNDTVTNIALKSPISSKLNSKSELPLPLDQPLYPKPSSEVDVQHLKQPTEKMYGTEKKPRSFSQYNHLPLYVKLRENMKSAYNNYEVTLKPESSEKFVTFLKTILEVFGVVLDFTTLSEVDRICKDLLLFLRNFMVFLPAESVHCVMQLLKSVFATNMIADHLLSFHRKSSTVDCENLSNSEGFYSNCFQQPYDGIAKLLSDGSKIQKIESHKEREAYHKKRGFPMMKPAKRSINLNILPSYIKLFEPNVIQSLRHYTVTSDTALQAEVLYLLSELIQLKVNYCLLDSEQVFIKFVLNQFQLIEDEQLLNIHQLLPAMFNFLIHLANEKHSKPVMTVPKVIQLCDSLIAGVQTISHCIIAIEPVVHHVFLKSSLIVNANDTKELETQREFLFTKLLKLIHNARTMKLLMIILNHSNDEIKIKRSNQIVDVLFDALEGCRITIDYDETSVDILNLLLTLHASSFNERRLLNIIFNICHSNKLSEPNSWIPFLTPVLLMILAKCDESELLANVGQMLNHPVFLDDGAGTVDPLCVSVMQESKMAPAQAFNQFLCENTKLILRRINDTKLFKNSSCEDVYRRIRMLSEFLSVFLYIMKSDKFETLKNDLISNTLRKTDTEDAFLLELDRLNSQLLGKYPPIILRWYDLVLHLSNSYMDFGQNDTTPNISRSVDSVYKANKVCLSNDIVKLGLFLLASEHQNEFVNSSEKLRVVLASNFDLLLDVIDEPVVQVLLANIQKSEIASSVLIEVIKSVEDQLLKCNRKLKRVLRCFGFCHIRTSTQVLLFCCRPEILDNSVPISDHASVLARERIEYLVHINERIDFEGQLTEQDLQALVESLKRTISPKTRDLVDPLCQLAVKWYGTQISPSRSNRPLDIDKLRSVTTDKQWFFNLVKHKCCNANETRYYTMAVLLGYLPLQDIFSIMRSQHFNNKILRHSFALGTQLNLQWEGESGQTEVEFSNLFLASRLAIFRHIEHVKSLLPKFHEVYMPRRREASRKEMQYRQRMESVFSDKEFVHTIRCLIPAVDEYLSSLRKLQPKVELHVVVASSTFENLVDFAVLCVEMAHWLVRNDRHWLQAVVIDALKCCRSVLKVKEIMAVVTSSHIGSIASALHTLVETCTKDTIKYSPNPMVNEFPDDPSCMYHSGHLISTLIEYFITKVPKIGHSFASVVQFSKELLIVLSQSTLVYDYVRIPLEIWKHVSKEDVVVRSCLTLNTISENFLLDSDILQNFVSRLMFVGWNCRMQFEECWMSLLIALNSLPEYESSEEEIGTLSQVHAVTISAVTSLLVQTMYHPTPGCKTSPNSFHVSRNTFDGDLARWKLKLESVNDLFLTQAEIKNENVFCLFNSINVNLERLHTKNLYDFNQISIEYLTLCCQDHASDELNIKSSSHRRTLIQLHQQRQNAVKEIGIDTNSCVYFLMDFYSRWLLKPDGQSIGILLEVVNSLLVISDLFTETTQFAWLLESAFILWKKCSKDDVVCSYLIVILCKAAAMCTHTDSSSMKLISKILNSGLCHSNTTVQTASLHGLLYLLESIFKRSVLNQNFDIDLSFETEILSQTVLYILENLDIDLSETYEDRTINCMISVAYYLIENNSCGDTVNDVIIYRLLKLSVRACKLKRWQIHITVIQSFYNLILAEHSAVKKFDLELRQLVKEILSTLECTSSVALLSLQMLAALMYASGDFEDTRVESPDETFDTEKLIARRDKISIFFDRMKKSDKAETQFICSILPQILNDFFHASEILNKVISEFISPQQPYPELLAEVVFKVFQNAIQQSQLMLIQDWVLSLLNNFLNYPVPQAVFYLTCFFISACENAWLTALFPSLRLSRSHEVEYEDRKLLCISAAYFYSQLKEEPQKKAFVSTFQAAEKRHPGSSFSDVLLTIS